ncbi:MAG: hypothetical protein U5L75_00355 [Candidatus Campbellbacteria bacterium]|nr:hypothetical protein [Candidatus Campbellbacteria bacterium]
MFVTVLLVAGFVFAVTQLIISIWILSVRDQIIDVFKENPQQWRLLVDLVERTNSPKYIVKKALYRLNEESRLECRESPHHTAIRDHRNRPIRQVVYRLGKSKGGTKIKNNSYAGS